MQKISVIVPVYNEEENVLKLLKNLNPGEEEIIIVDGNPKGNTIKAIPENSSLENLKTVISPSRGRGEQMNYGSTMASGEILLFLHADTTLPHNWRKEVTETVSAGFGAGCFSLSFDSDKSVMKAISFFANIRTSISRIPFGDQGIFFSNPVFRQIGGFSTIPIMEDIDIMQKYKKTGKPLKILPHRVTTSARKWIQDGVIYTTVRNGILQFLYYCGVKPENLVKFYYRNYGNE